MRIAKEGLASVPELERMPADQVMDLWDYVRYCSEFVETYSALNKQEKP